MRVVGAVRPRRLQVRKVLLPRAQLRAAIVVVSAVARGDHHVLDLRGGSWHRVSELLDRAERERAVLRTGIAVVDTPSVAVAGEDEPTRNRATVLGARPHLRDARE